jgi:ribosome-associated protein
LMEGTESNGIRVTPELTIGLQELEYRATRSGGPGGQHVNTSSTRIELTWDVANSPSLSDAQRERLLDKLAARMDSSGVLRITESGSRSQLQNKETATARLAELVAAALHLPKPRKKTRPPKASREKRLQTKRRRSEVKKLRGPVKGGE